MYYGDEILDDIRNRCNIVDLIGTYVSLKRAGGSYKGLCPFHNEKTPSFMVTPSKKMFYCFGCHKGGDVFTFLQDYENMTFVEAVQFLAEREGITLPEVTDNPEAKRRDSMRETLFRINSLAGQYYFSYLRDSRGQVGMDYFKSRGISDEMMKKFALGFAPQSGGGERQNYGKSRFEWLNLAARSLGDIAAGFSREQFAEMENQPKKGK